MTARNDRQAEPNVCVDPRAGLRLRRGLRRVGTAPAVRLSKRLRRAPHAQQQLCCTEDEIALLRRAFRLGRERRH